MAQLVPETKMTVPLMGPLKSTVTVPAAEGGDRRSA